MRKGRGQKTRPIQAPEPPETSEYTDVPPDFGRAFEYEDLRLRDTDLAELAASGVRLERVVMERVALARANLRRSGWLDARLDGCDLAGSAWERATLTRVRMDGCRLLGATFAHATLSDLTVREVNGEMALFIGAAFTAARFERCNLRGASFDGADLRGVVFRGCDLRNADLRNCRLEGTDLRGSSLAGLALDTGNLRGLVLDPAQALDVVEQLGAIIRPLDDESDPGS